MGKKKKEGEGGVEGKKHLCEMMYVCVCVCVCACECQQVRVCVCVCAHMCVKCESDCSESGGI